MTVLVLTKPSDATADLVIAELTHRGLPVVRLDPGDFPEAIRATARLVSRRGRWEGTFSGQHRDLVLEDVTSAYYRRPSPFRPHPGMSARDAQWASAEAAAALGGLLTSLNCTWVNHPARNAVAGVKPNALAAAVRCGLSVPETLITNDPEEARAFIADQPGHVAAYKALGSTGPSGPDGEPAALWTTQVRAGDIDSSVALTAHQFQEWIVKAYEVRVTVVACQLFAAKIHTSSGRAVVDIRTDYDDHVYEPCEVPPAVARGVCDLLATFGLRYAAIDFLVDHDGGWTMIDLNPNGQWAFIPELRAPLTRALADLLETSA